MTQIFPAVSMACAYLVLHGKAESSKPTACRQQRTIYFPLAYPHILQSRHYVLILFVHLLNKKY